ncbi:MAG: hypothetical protein LBH90_01200 [Tannerella sp.]|jgi:CxxC motif-containing protein (DUF1111 family)|nr:hypothetical protein [Tannerella sp.]
MLKKVCFLLLSSFLLAFTACKDDDDPLAEPERVDVPEEKWYAGGELGTVFNATSFAYEQPAPAVEYTGMAQAFKLGEYLFENDFNQNQTGAFCGLGPLMIRHGCLYCHPGYGHGKRQTEYRSNRRGNGYLLVITDETDTYLSSLTGMPQTMAVTPFKPPVDETKIKIDWLTHVDEWGNKFPDGETYELIYPEVTIPKDAYYVPLEVTKNNVTTTVPFQQVKVRLESTIGVYGTGLLDAIADNDLKAEYARQEQLGMPLNPDIFAGGNWVKTYANTGRSLRFTYALSRGPLQDGAGANAIWNITNVTRSNRTYHYMTGAYAKTASQDKEVQEAFYTYFPEQNKTGDVEKDIYNYLTATDLDVEMKDKSYENFMIWHRGLAVPAARNLDDPDVQKGEELFTTAGCAMCHKPSWTTGPDNVSDPSGFFTDNDPRLPRYPNQKIWPYSDMVQHKLYMKNDIRTGWCRTTPLWGRGLSHLVTGAGDRLHDCRARNVVEAVMWHGSADSHARKSAEKFRTLTKAERDAIVKFINAI